MSKKRPKVFIVDDDAAFNRSLARLVKSIGFEVESFLAAEEFLRREVYTGTSCLLLDVRMPRLTGPGLQQEFSRRKILMPIIFLTAHGDTATGIKAMKDGAVDYLLKPVEEKCLRNAIARALDQDVQIKKKTNEIKKAKSITASLTPREYEVFRWVIAGMLNKQIASRLGTTERTIKAHRSKIIRKLNIVSVAGMVRIAQKAEISPAIPPGT